MPSASTKIEITASSEALGPMVKVLNVIEKKVRNLEKRKSKLDAYRQKVDQGNELEADQKEAVNKYGEVLQNLEFARELQKQFQSIHSEAEKLVKKQAKREKSEKQQQELKRIGEILQLQGLMDNLGADNVRADFKSGKHGAIVLTEENLEQIDELYKLISPSRDSQEGYAESLSTAADHIMCLLDARDKPVAGTTYKELKELLDLIAACGYFEKAQDEAEATEDQSAGGEAEFEVVDHKDVPDPDSEEVQASLPPEVVEITEEEPSLPDSQPQQQRMDTTTPTGLTTQPQVPNVAAEADSFFSTPVNQTIEQQQQQQQAVAAAAFSRQRPFQEIVSSVQGNFNFLQESTIEVEAKREFSPHMDPAVVAAHPMPQSQSLARPPSNQTPEATPLSQTGFGASSFGEQQFPDQDTEVPSSSQTAPHSASVDQNFSQANTVSSQDFASSGFSQTNLTHTLQTDNLFSGAVSAAETPSGISHSVIGQGPSDSSITQFDIPPQIPMPPGHEQQSQESGPATQVEKKAYHHMNPNASEFQSLLYAQGEEQQDEKNSHDNTNFQGTTFTNSNFQQQQHQGRDQRSGSSGGGRGGFRGGRGSRGGSGYMSNGYSRGGSRNNGGGYDNRSSNMGGSGSGNYQNYPQRNDYRQDGYQGNSGNFNNGGSYQKRGTGGFSRGGSRGGPRGGGGSGFSRGGPPRGSYANRGGFGRPNFNQQQSAQ